MARRLSGPDVRTVGYQKSEAPNENVVQKHLNIALLNVFWYLNGRFRHIFIP